MKKEYIAPSTDLIVLITETNLAAGSENGASSEDSDSKRMLGDVVEDEDGNEEDALFGNTDPWHIGD